MERLHWIFALARDPELTKADVAIASVILEHQNAASGLAWPGKALIARLARVRDLSTVKRSVRRLVARGWLIVESGGMKSNGDRYSNRYRCVTSRMLPSGDE